MPSAPTTIRIRAWLTRSLLTTGPIVVSEPCDEIGPSSASSAVTISPSLPSVGRSPRPAPADGDGEAAGERARPRRRGWPTRTGWRSGGGRGRRRGRRRCGRRRAAARRRRAGCGRRRAMRTREAERADALADGDARRRRRSAGASATAPAGCRPIGSVLISKKPSLVTTTDASRPLAAKTCFDLVRRHGGILEGELPLRAAGVVDRELEALLAAGQDRQEDEDQARDRDECREEEVPATLPDDVKHAAPRAGVTAGRRRGRRTPPR